MHFTVFHIVHIILNLDNTSTHFMKYFLMLSHVLRKVQNAD